jgi:hypothetical protein
MLELAAQDTIITRRLTAPTQSFEIGKAAGLGVEQDSKYRQTTRM